MIERIVTAAFGLTLVTVCGQAHGQDLPPPAELRPNPSAGPAATVGSPPPPSARPADVAAGVYRAAVPGTTPVRFELRASHSDVIGASADGDDPMAPQFIPACETPCTLWFTQGVHIVELGHSPLRGRAYALGIDDRPMHVRFSRDSVLGVLAGVALAGLGVIAVVVGLPQAVSDHQYTNEWWGLTAGGVAFFLGGSAITFAAFGHADTQYEEARERANNGAH